jgi:hypothetical protein
MASVNLEITAVTISIHNTRPYYPTQRYREGRLSDNIYDDPCLLNRIPVNFHLMLMKEDVLREISPK